MLQNGSPYSDVASWFFPAVSYFKKYTQQRAEDFCQQQRQTVKTRLPSWSGLFNLSQDCEWRSSGSRQSRGGSQQRYWEREWAGKYLELLLSLFNRPHLRSISWPCCQWLEHNLGSHRALGRVEVGPPAHLAPRPRVKRLHTQSQGPTLLSRQHLPSGWKDTSCLSWSQQQRGRREQLWTRHPITLQRGQWQSTSR